MVKLMSTFTLHLEEPDRPTTGREAFAYPTGLAVWAIGPLPDAEDWSWAMRYAIRDDVLILTEKTVHPTQKTPAANDKPWEWSRDTDDVPDSGLPLTADHNVPFGRIDSQIRQAFANYDHPAWQGRGDVIGDPPLDRYLEWEEVTSRSGIDRNRTASPVRPGRPRLTDKHLAEVALHYTTALTDGYPTTRYVTEQMQEGNEYLPASAWVSKARERDFLTPTPTKGRPGGYLTDRAKAVIAEHNLQSPRPETNGRTGE